jgi:hypothetical protein
MIVLKLISTCLCGAVLLVYSPILKTVDPIIEVGTRRVDVTVTVVIFGALLLFEALQVWTNFLAILSFLDIGKISWASHLYLMAAWM